jgi:hypothetical protein
VTAQVISDLGRLRSDGYCVLVGNMRVCCSATTSQDCRIAAGWRGPIKPLLTSQNSVSPRSITGYGATSLIRFAYGRVRTAGQSRSQNGHGRDDHQFRVGLKLVGVYNNFGLTVSRDDHQFRVGLKQPRGSPSGALRPVATTTNSESD